MRTVNLSQPSGSPDPLRTARLTRHLRARLLDFDPGGPEVTAFDEETGTILVRFPGHDTAQILRRLEQKWGILVGQQEGLARFTLSPGISFEDLDYVWGCLFELLA